MGFEMEEIGDPRTTSELMVSPPTWRVFQRQVQGNGSNFAGRRQWRGKLGERGNISCGFGGRTDKLEFIMDVMKEIEEVGSGEAAGIGIR
ncbi:hypothetical protein LINPERHAP2_LOCUS39970 [Linum perenne]